ncbi:unnamed protein product [Schistosoma mansoni]|nr:unnamed protein product [Schistosoma mansoni]|eukprot:XP_018644734.1 unnamed protein product [Schistosoma mansoni]
MNDNTTTITFDQLITRISIISQTQHTNHDINIFYFRIITSNQILITIWP